MGNRNGRRNITIGMGANMADGVSKAGQQLGVSESAVSEASFTSILEEHDVQRQQRDTRRKLLEELALPRLNGQKKPVAVIGHVSHTAISSEDIPVLGNVLRKIGDVDTLNLILHSPGGDGTVVEKFVALCRTQCRCLRVVIPNEAKSAATLIALGADEIVMGPPSELGPIDAQVPVQVNGMPRYVSAQSFIDARDTLLKQHADAVASGEDTAAILQMVASLDLPFIVECERLMDFGRDVGQKLLEANMFAHHKDKKTKAKAAVTSLSSVELHKVHGRTIDGSAAKRDLGLKVRLCGNDDAFWQKAWEWYTRAEILLAKGRAFKIFETKHEQLIGYYRQDGA